MRFIFTSLFILFSLLIASPTIAEDVKGLPLDFGLDIDPSHKYIFQRPSFHNEIGRYHIFVVPFSTPDPMGVYSIIKSKVTILLDTKTGKIWTLDYQKRFNIDGKSATIIPYFSKGTTEGISETNGYQSWKQDRLE